MTMLDRARKNSCTRKRAYLVIDRAIEEAKAQSKDGSFGVYRCRFCNMYHIGHYNGQRNAIFVNPRHSV